jgi:hypothetical protein
MTSIPVLLGEGTASIRSPSGGTPHADAIDCSLMGPA